MVFLIIELKLLLLFQILLCPKEGKKIDKDCVSDNLTAEQCISNESVARRRRSSKG